MHPEQIRFDDGAAYEAFMGKWSRLVGDDFLQWLAPPHGWRWVDVGCGNGAFTQMLVDRLAPAAVQGIDPSGEQIAYARKRIDRPSVGFRLGDSMALPYADDAFDAAVMALVIFFVPEPARGVAEMARVVRPGGSVSSYAWDFVGGGFPIATVHEEMAALGIPPLWPPSFEASRIDALRALWTDAGLVQIATRVITVERTFDDFESYWSIALKGPRIAPRIASMDADQVVILKERLHARLVPAADGTITCSAVANAIRGEVPR